jgi:crossover junction endodeoxyribonuclease RuvC
MFHKALQEKIERFKISSLALETPFLGKNAQNFLKLGYLRGILYLLADTYKLELHEFTPMQVKQSVTGYGGAGKDQVARVLHSLFPALKISDKYDATDALAVALSGLWAKDQLQYKIAQLRLQ